MKERLIQVLLVAMVINPAVAQPWPAMDDIFRLKQLEPPSGKVRMVLDTDTYNEVDDQFALAYALLSPENVELEAVYAAPFQNKRSTGPADGMEKSYEEILRMLKMFGRSPEGFAFRGSEAYLGDVSSPLRSDAAEDLIKRALESSPENPLYVVTVGCITNIASAILLEPKIIENIVIVWLGGNSLDWAHQREFNLQQDVLSARVVLDSGVPLVILPTRPVISHFHTTIPELKHYLEGKNELADYLYRIVVEYSKGREAWSKVIWDVTGVAWLVNPAWIPTQIVHSPLLTDQVTYSQDLSRHLIRMASAVDRDAVFRDLFGKLSDGFSSQLQ